MNRILTGRQYLLQVYLHGNQVSQAFDEDDFVASLQTWNPVAVRWHRDAAFPFFLELPERLKIAAKSRKRNGVLNTVHLRLDYYHFRLGYYAAAFGDY